MTNLEDATLEQLLSEIGARFPKEANVEFFYTTDTPHQWSSGPRLNFYDSEKRDFIHDFDRARECALKARAGKVGYESHVVTSFGVLIKTRDRDSNS